MKNISLLVPFLVGLVVSSVWAEDSEYVYEFAPETQVQHLRNASRSKFVWAADGETSGATTAFIRYKFTLPSVPVDASLYYYLDDKGTVYMNGHALGSQGSAAYQYLVAGENTVAIAATNTQNAAGVIFTIKCFDSKNSSTRNVIATYHCDATAKAVAQMPSSGWTSPSYDDSSWPAAKILGDAFSEPWYKPGNWYYTDAYLWHTTPEERENFSSGNYEDPALPSGLAEEPDPVARVVYRGASPFIEINGALHEPTLNITQTGDAYNESGIVRCANVGFDIVQLNFTMDDFYKGDGVPCNFDLVNTRVRRLLEIVPNAKVMMSLRFTMSQWAKDHPDEQVGYDTGAADPTATDEYRERVVRPSSASDAFHTLVRSMLTEFGTYVDGMVWRKRLIGLRMSYGVYSEWCCYGFNETPDTGVRMQEKFRAYELEKRGIANASVPTAAMRKHETTDASNPNLSGDLLDPAQDQLVLDYYEFLANMQADLLLDMADAAKQAFPGRLVGAYYGYIYASDPPEGSSVLLDKVLSSPKIDFLSNPPAYNVATRRAGGSYAPRSIPSAFRRYGKLSLLEDDSRFHHIRDWLASANDGLNLCTADAVETEMNMRRNWLNQLFDGDGVQINDPITQSGTRPHAFDDPAVFKAITDSRAALAAAGEPASESGNTVALVISPRERLRMDGGAGSYFTWNLYLTPIDYMYRTGTTFDILTLEDYLDNPRDYKTVVFLNAFYLTAEERTTLIARMRQPGMTAVWFGPAGGVTESGFDDAAMSQLTGITSTGVARRSRIVNKDSAAKAINYGLAYSKTFANGARSIIVPEMPDTPADYKKILTEAGVWFYTDTGSYFRRHGNVFMFHTGTAGTHTIRLPETEGKVRELFSGTEYEASSVTVTTTGPGTWLFKLEEPYMWTLGENVFAATNANGVLTISGSGTMSGVASAADLPWNPAAVTRVVVEEGVTVGANVYSDLADTVTVNGMALGNLRRLAAGFDASIPENMTLVSKTELEAPNVATLQIANGRAYVGISVCTNANLSVSTSEWQPVSFGKVDFEVSADGTQILAPIPVDAQKGFMILRSRPVK